LDPPGNEGARPPTVGAAAADAIAQDAARPAPNGAGRRVSGAMLALLACGAAPGAVVGLKLRALSIAPPDADRSGAPADLPAALREPAAAAETELPSPVAPADAPDIARRVQVRLRTGQDLSGALIELDLLGRR